ncbi:MAG: hypothetical protein E7Z86_03905 [Methanosphaera stadtmanae]|jgi:hypothetical protein|nr:hypothetical protein [Methanosphaera stadtmanae]
MLKSKYIKGFFLLTLVLLACISVVSATDTTDDATADVVETSSISTQEVETNSFDEVQTSDNTQKTNKNIKKETRSLIEVNDSNFDYYFTSNGFTDNVTDEDTISFTTNISRYNNTTYVVNKPVTILGNNKTITLNTTSGAYEGNETGSSFIFDKGASGSTISDLAFYNTQVIVRNTTNIVFDNINQTVFNQRIGQGIGTFSIRDNSSFITVENSRFSTTNNSGSSTLVLAAAYNCTIHNNNITGSGNVGNLLYLTTYNIVGMANTDLELNSYNYITNNRVSRPEGESDITWGITLTGHDNHIENNIVDIYGQGITTQWFYTDPATPQIGNNSDRYKGNYYINNTIYNNASFKPTNNSTITSNTLNGVTLGHNCTFIKNTAAKVSLTGQNNLLCNNTITELNVASQATNNKRCECNNISIITGTVGNCPLIFCSNCPFCDDNSDELTSNAKVLKADDDENVFIFNITNEESFNQYMPGGRIDDGLISVKNATYIFYLEYFPNNVSSLRLNNVIKNIRSSTLKIYGMNNLTLTNVDIFIEMQARTFIMGNLTLNYNNDHAPVNSWNMLTVAPIRSNTFLIENVTINHNKRLNLETNDFPDENPINVIGYFECPVNLNNVTVNMNTDSTPVNWDGQWNVPYTIPLRYIPSQTQNANLTVSNSTFNFNEIDTYYEDNEYHSVYGVYLGSNTTFIDNTINVNGSQCVYGIVARGGNNIISNNTINSKSTGYYACGIDVESSNIANNILENNYINVTAGYGENANQNPHVAYGALILDYSYKGFKYVPNEYSVENVSYINNTIIADAGQAYGVEIYGGNNLNISDNNIYLTSRVPMGIGAIGENVTISGNTIIANGTNNATESTVDYLTSRTVGVYTRFTSVGVNITNNNINMTTGRGIFIDHSNNTVSYNNTVNVGNYTYAVEINNGTANSIHDNYLVTPDLKGDESVSDYVGTDNIIENNLPKVVKEYSVVVDTTEFTPGQNATIQASINYGTESSHEVAINISKGKISFKVDGKTLKDTKGKVIYAKVTNGVAMIENYQIPDTWTEKTTIQAVYSGSSDVAKMSSEKTAITITATEPTITTEDVTATVGATVTLSATINTNVTVNTGKVVFKINGKTVKDANGKVIYAKVSNNQVNMEYTLPEQYKAGAYNITAVFVSSNYRLEDSKTLTITEA